MNVQHAGGTHRDSLARESARNRALEVKAEAAIKAAAVPLGPRRESC